MPPLDTSFHCFHVVRNFTDLEEAQRLGDFYIKVLCQQCTKFQFVHINSAQRILQSGCSAHKKENTTPSTATTIAGNKA